MDAINDQVPLNPNPEMQQLLAMTQKTQLVRTEVTDNIYEI